jgi:hypothetical protein
LHAEVHLTKTRGIFGKDDEPFEVSLQTDVTGSCAWTVSDIQKQSFEKAAELFDEGCDLLAVMQELGLSRATAFRYRKRWKEYHPSQDAETD